MCFEYVCLEGGEGGLIKSNLKKLDPSYKTELDFGRETPVLQLNYTNYCRNFERVNLSF